MAETNITPEENQEFIGELKKISALLAELLSLFVKREKARVKVSAGKIPLKMGPPKSSAKGD